MNKEDLDKLSDGELSQLITNLNDYGAFYHFDINNWADMGPLIYESLIETAPLANSDKWKATGVTFSKRGERATFTVHHENPLRAAAIVYLLMQNDSHER